MSLSNIINDFVFHSNLFVDIYGLDKLMELLFQKVPYCAFDRAEVYLYLLSNERTKKLAHSLESKKIVECNDWIPLNHYSTKKFIKARQPKTIQERISTLDDVPKNHTFKGLGISKQLKIRIETELIRHEEYGIYDKTFWKSIRAYMSMKAWNKLMHSIHGNIGDHNKVQNLTMLYTDPMRFMYQYATIDEINQFQAAKKRFEEGKKEYTEQKYMLPQISKVSPPQEQIKRYNCMYIKTEIPSRLDAPLIPYPNHLRDHIISLNESILPDVQANHMCTIQELLKYYNIFKVENNLESLKISTNIDDLKQFSLQEYSLRTQIIHATSFTNAVKSTNIDISSLSNIQNDLHTQSFTAHPSLSFLYTMQRARPIINSFGKLLAKSPSECNVKFGPHSMYHIYAKSISYSYQITVFGQHFFIYHSSLPFVFFGPKTYLDYLLTISDVINNVEIILNSEEYKYLELILLELQNLLYNFRPHNYIVEYMKNYESLCLFISDIKTSQLVNWDPILDTLSSMIEISNKISKKKIDMNYVLYQIIYKDSMTLEDSHLSKLLDILCRLTPQSLLESSALHKFLFFAEVDSQAGIEKFLKRTHTKRIIDHSNLILMMGLTKREFIISYIKKHKYMPNILTPIEKSIMIDEHFKSNEINLLFQLPLDWWYNINFGKCIDWSESGHSVEYAKDKGAIINDVTFSGLDNQRELIQVLESEDYSADNFLSDINIDIIPSSVIKTKMHERSTNVRFPVRLCEKEKEQKIEARLFGVATARFKHKMSQYMSQAKRLLSYFDEQNMTITDSSRKDNHHEMSQELHNNDMYAIMLDIQGHNQSMQPENTCELLEFIGQVYGENNWGKLAYLFNNLLVYHYDNYLDDVVISSGQLGGIEGWMNPVWTLVTLQQMKLLRTTTTIDIPMISTYSDDVAAIVKIESPTQYEIDSILETISLELFKLGFVVKSSQTAVSKSRLTLLRQHTVRGIKADSTLKKLLSISTCGNARIVSDEFEIDSISSTVSSALEDTYHIKACLLLKWYKSYLLSGYILGSLFSERRDKSMLSTTNIPHEFASIFYNVTGPTKSELSRTQKDFEKSVEISLTATLDILGNPRSKEAICNWLHITCTSTLEEQKSKQVSDVILYLSAEKVFLQELWLYILIMPQSLGGLGVPLLINEAISGNSDSVFKSLYYIHRLIGKNFTYKDYFFHCLTASLKFHKIEDKDLFPNNIIESKWISNSRIHQAKSSLNNKLLSVMKKLNKNQKLIKMFECKSIQPELSKLLISIFENNFSHRVVQFYLENSILSLVQYLLRKLETSTSLINKIQNLKEFKRSLAIRTISNTIELFSQEGLTFGEINRNTDILSYLITRRRLLAPKIKFVDIEEPLYDHNLEESTSNNYVIQLYPARPITYNNGKLSIKKGNHNSNTLYKGELKEEDIFLETKEEVLISKVVSVTKWSLMKSKINYQFNNLDLEYDFVLACNATLSTLTNKRFSDLESYVPLNMGGEILHRIPNQRFRSNVTTRILPNSVQYIHSSLNQTGIVESKLEDSNINFDYIRLRLLMSIALKKHYDNEMPGTIFFGLKNLENIYNVQDYTPKLINKIDTDVPIKVEYLPSKDIELSRISLVSKAYFYAEDFMSIYTQEEDNSSNSIKSMIERRNQDIIMQYYNEMYREFIYLDEDLSNNELWLPLIDKLSELDQDYRDRSTRNSITKIKQLISANLNDTQTPKFMKEHRNLLSSRMQSIRSEMLNLSDTYKLTRSICEEVNNEKKKGIIGKGNERLLRTVSRSIVKTTIELFKDLALGYCMAVAIESDQIILDVKKTYENTLDVISRSELNDLVPGSLKLLILFIGSSRALEIVIKNSRKLMKYLTYISKRNHIKYMSNANIKVSFPIRRLVASELSIPTSIYQCSYDIQYIPISIRYDMNKLLNMMPYFRKISECYAHQDSFYSPTGSDSVYSQFGVLDAMLTFRKIEKTSKIISLTSGRGDSIIACKMLDLVGDHYSKPTAFSRVDSLSDVILDYDYDVTRYNTLPNLNPYDVVLIDISHIKGQTSGLYDTIMNIMMDKKIVIIRANSLPEIPDIYTKLFIDNSISISYSYPKSRNILPYQQYFIFEQSIEIQHEPEIEFKDFNAYLNVSRNYTSHINYSNMNIIPESDLDNSILHTIDRNKSFEEMLDIVTAKTNLDGYVGVLKSILRNNILLNEIPIDHSSEEYLMTLLHTNIKFSKPIAEHIIYDDAFDEDCGNSRQRGYKIWKKNVQSYHNKTNKLSLIVLKDLGIEKISMIQRCHPIASIRTYLKNYLFMRSNGVNLENLTMESINNLLMETIENNNMTFGDQNADIRKALGLILGSVYIGNYSWGLRQLFTVHDSNDSEKRKSNRLISIYRKLAPIFKQFRNERVTYNMKMDTIRVLTDNIVRPTIERNLKRLELVKPMNEDEISEEVKRDFANVFRGFIDQLESREVSFLPEIFIAEDISKIDPDHNLRNKSLINEQPEKIHDIATVVNEDLFIPDIGNILNQSFQQILGDTGWVGDELNRLAEEEFRMEDWGCDIDMDDEFY